MRCLRFGDKALSSLQVEIWVSATFVRPLTLVAELAAVSADIQGSFDINIWRRCLKAKVSLHHPPQVLKWCPIRSPRLSHRLILPKDDLQVYSQKVRLLLETWPEGKYTELATRLVLNCAGSAFLKLQLHQQEIMVNEKKSIRKIIEILGGHWGQISLEKRHAYAERALYRCTQKAEDTADSYLARADIMWTELNSRDLKLADLQAYETLHGSALSAEDTKKVLVDSDAAGKGDLSITKVSSAIRLLGAGFFQEVTGVK